MDRIKQQIDMLAELSDEQVVELQTDIINEFETVEKEDPTPQTVDAMTSLADMLDTVRGEVSRREAQAQELAARAAEAAMRVKGEAAMDDMPEAEKTEDEMEKEDADVATQGLRSFMSGGDYYSQGEVSSEMSKLLRLLT